MAGMLPGVEAARRRRFHNSNLNYGSEMLSSSSLITASRRSTLCLYAISSYVFHSNSSSMMRRSHRPHGLRDDESSLCTAAREAKKRLDQRLQPQIRTSLTKRVEPPRIAPQQRSSSISFSSGGPPSPKPQATTKLKKKNWLKLIRWKSWEQEECTVCLDPLGGGGGTLMQLPCGHRFHTKCLVPWLDANINNAHCPCPCCRMEIPS